MFTVEERDRLQAHVLSVAEGDDRVVGAALLGSLAAGSADARSDVDLMLAIADGESVEDVMDAFTRRLEKDVGAVHLFDLASGAITYRVFVLPNSLELDLSMVPASDFGASGPRFLALFGDPVHLPAPTVEPPEEVFGYAVHHALHARIAIDRGRPWLAEYWISAVRDRGLALACQRRGLDGSYGRDFDRLPAEVLDSFGAAIVRSLVDDELRRALRSAVDALLRESDQVRALAAKVGNQLKEATRADG